MMELLIGVLNVSDRASQGIYDDTPGKEVKRLLKEYLSVPFRVEYAVIPDDQPTIEERLIDLADNRQCSLVFTTGGTGPASRDVTPEATSSVCEKMLPGFGEQMRSVSLQYVPTAILSRQTAWIRGSTLIVNFPGKPKAIKECLDAILPAIPYCVDLIGGARIECHADKVKVFRPKPN